MSTPDVPNPPRPADPNASIGVPIGEHSEGFGPIPSPGEIPVLPDNATPEQKDLHWYTHVYQGDRMPQLTWRAVIMGGFLGMLMSAANLYTTLSIGWAFGIAITACVLSFVIWNFVRFCSGNKLSQMTILENACMASTASAAGYSTGSTVAVMFGAIMLLQDVPEGKTLADIKTLEVTPIWIVTIFTFCTGLMGVFLAIPMKRQMINHEQLPFPSGIAAAETLRSLYSASQAALRKAYVLVIGMGAGLLIGFLRADMSITEKIPFLKAIFKYLPRIPGEIEITLFNRLYPAARHPVGMAFEPSALLIAAGMVVGMRTSLSLVASSLVLYLGVGPYLAGLDAQTLAAMPGVDPNLLNFRFMGDTGIMITRWSLWGGTATMVFASLTSVALQWRTLARAFTGGSGSGISAESSAKLAAIEVPVKWMIIGMLPITIAMVWLQIVAFEVAWWAGIIAVAMSFVLSMVGSRATGETDTTPIGAMGKVMQLLFAFLAPGNVQANLASAGIAANSASSSADLLTDLKTGYLLGANPRRQFLAQFFGVFFGTLAIVPIWYLMVPNRAVLEEFNMPGTRSWEAVARLLTKGIDSLPDSARWAILIGALVGIGLPVLERLMPKDLRKYLPSATGVGLAWVLTFSNAFSFFIGAVIASIWYRINKKSQEDYNIPVASGLIAGESLMAAGLAIAATVYDLVFAKGA